MTTPFRTSRRIEFGDTDMAGIVHYSNFFRFMEAAEQAFLRSLGLSVALEWEGQPIGFPRVSAHCDYSRPARFEDVVDIEVRLKQLGRKSVTYSFVFSKNDEILARGEVSSVCCRGLGHNNIESLEIPAGIREKLQPYAQGA